MRSYNLNNILMTKKLTSNLGVENITLNKCNHATLRNTVEKISKSSIAMCLMNLLALVANNLSWTLE